MPAGHLHRRLLRSGGVLPFADYLISLGDGLIIPFQESIYEASQTGWEDYDWGSDDHSEAGDSFTTASAADYQQTAIISGGGYANYSMRIKTTSAGGGVNAVGISVTPATGTITTIGEGRTIGVFVKFGYLGSASVSTHALMLSAAQHQIGTSDSTSSTEVYIRPTSRGVGTRYTCEDLNPSSGSRLLVITSEVTANGPNLYRHKYYVGGVLEHTQSGVDFHEGTCDNSMDITLRNQGQTHDSGNGTKDNMWVQDLFMVDYLMNDDEVAALASNYE